MLPHSPWACPPLVGCSGLLGDVAGMDVPAAADPLLSLGCEVRMRARGSDDMNVRLVAVRSLDADIRKRDVKVVRPDPTETTRLCRGDTSTEFGTAQLERHPV